jgi:hypothetical protein
VKQLLLVPFLALSIFSSAAEAQRAKPTPCPGVNDITDCPDEGCGQGIDPELNKRKNIRSDDQPSVLRSIQWLQKLKSPPKADFCDADDRNRDQLRELGEGQKITVMAWALAARKGGQESCNCKLKLPHDTDNHIVLVDPDLDNPTLAANEKKSQTAEFTPHVRLDHPNFTQDRLESLIDPDWDSGETPRKGKLLVRVTGLLMFDSEHYCHNPLARQNNWEIHPVLKIEYCADGQTCRADSDENWIDLDGE